MMNRSRIITLCFGILMVLFIGCQGMPKEKPPIHPNPNMDQVGRYDPQSESNFFVDGRSMRQPVEIHSPLLDLQQAFGYTQEDLKLLMSPMATTGQEAIGSMGTDTPISVLSAKTKLLYTYFKQNFAQVTNPPIDPIREESVMSLVSLIGPRPNLFDLEGLATQKRLEVRQPILTNDGLLRLR